MSDDSQQTKSARKHEVVTEVLKEDDLYKILGATRNASAAELRRCYLERGKICHPDKNPPHPLSTSAFQRLGFAFDILKSPSARRSYDRASKPSSSSLPDKTSFLGGEFTFRSAVETVLHEFMTGDFAVVRRWLDSLHQRYPHLVSSEVCIGIEKSFIRIRELVLTTTTYALLIYVELGRIHRVQKRLMGLGYLDVVGRTRLTILLVKVTLAVPMRVDRKLREKEEQKWRAEEQGCLARDGRERTAGILNERVSKVLEFIVGDAGLDEGVEDGGKAGAK